jgi:putative transposase
MKANADYKENPEKYKGLPKIPKYKEKDGFAIAIFTNQQAKLKRDGKIHFPQKAQLPPMKTTVKHFQQVRIVPCATCFVVEVVYKTEKRESSVFPENVLAIDLGLDNLATCVNNVGEKPFIVNGKVLKSMNQYYNKLKAKLMSFVGNRGTSQRIERLTFRRNQKIDDSLHKVSASIRDWCIFHQIGQVIIGKNSGWKQSIQLGKRTNQHFVSIPFNRLISQLQYKLSDVGIFVMVHEESYTSKVDHFAFEEMCHQEKYHGQRKKRGLFQSSIGRLLNADVNGAIGIARKVVGNAFVQGLLDRGDGLSPVRINGF